MAADARWLVVGHGSVGSFVTRRLASNGTHVSVFDPHPRVAPLEGQLVELANVEGAIDYAVSCVPPDAARGVPPLLRGVLRSDGLLFDWNSVSPTTKREIADAVDAGTVDVALLDTLDAGRERPRLAVAGGHSDTAATILRAQGFEVAVIGSEIGDAAAAKYLRSIFMKSLEALVLEFAALGSALDRGRVVRESIGANLGPEFVDFMDVLLETDRVHARRRADELQSAAETFGDDGWVLRLPAVATEVLREASRAWESDDAPSPTASADELALHLGRKLWRRSDRST